MNEKSGNGKRLRVSVLGGGAWGTTLALVSLRAGNPTTLIVRDEDALRTMTVERRHPRSLQGISLPPELDVSIDAVAVLTKADIVILAIPTQKLRNGIAPLANALRGKILISAAKGIEIGSLQLPTAIVRDILGDDVCVGALSGPNLSSEVAAGKPSTTVIASQDERAVKQVQSALKHSGYTRAMTLWASRWAVR